MLHSLVQVSAEKKAKFILKFESKKRIAFEQMAHLKILLCSRINDLEIISSSFSHLLIQTYVFSS